MINTVSVDDGVILTDDEVVALAAYEGPSIAGELPTVLGDDREMEAGRVRGSRSLFARGWLDPDSGEPCEGLAALRRALTAPVIVSYLGDAKGRRVTWGGSRQFFVDGDVGLFEQLHSVGLHSYARVPLSSIRSYVEDTLGAVESDGPASSPDDPGSGESMRLCLVARTRDSGVVVHARRNEVRIGRAAAAPAPDALPALHSTSARDAASEILEVVGIAI